MIHLLWTPTLVILMKIGFSSQMDYVEAIRLFWYLTSLSTSLLGCPYACHYLFYLCCILTYLNCFYGLCKVDTTYNNLIAITICFLTEFIYIFICSLYNFELSRNAVSLFLKDLNYFYKCELMT